jgi:hypothetical protein
MTQLLWLNIIMDTLAGWLSPAKRRCNAICWKNRCAATSR